MKNWSNFVDSYIRYCEMRGLRDSTIKQRQRLLYRFGLWLKSKGYGSKSISDLSERIILDFLKHSIRYKSKSTTFGRISVLNGFGEWLCMEGHWEKNPIKWIERPRMNTHRKVPKIHSRKDLIKVYQESFNHHIYYFKKLYPAVFIILYSTGIRRSELIDLSIEDWNEKERTLRITGSKVNRDRFVPLPKDAVFIVQQYLNARSKLLFEKGNTFEKSFFLNRSGQAITGEQVWKGLKNAALRAGVDNFKLHNLRHNCTTDLLENGVHITKVQRILGHASLESTFRYTHVTDENRAKTMKNHPINDILGVMNE